MAGQNETELEFISCPNFHDMKLLTLGPETAMSAIRRVFKGLPYHQWAHLNIQYMVMDDWQED